MHLVRVMAAAAGRDGAGRGEISGPMNASQDKSKQRRAVSLAGALLLLSSAFPCQAAPSGSPGGDVLPNALAMLPMIVAASTGNVTAMQALFAEGLPVDARDLVDNTPLLFAARYGRSELVTYLLERGADVNAQNRSGVTPLMESVRKGALDITAALLKAGADVTLTDIRHETALFDAVRYQDLAAIRLLAAWRSPLDVPNDHGYTALMYATEEAPPEIAAALVALGADPDWRGPGGRSAACLAARHHDAAMQRALGRSGTGHCAPALWADASRAR